MLLPYVSTFHSVVQFSLAPACVSARVYMLHCAAVVNILYEVFSLVFPTSECLSSFLSYLFLFHQVTDEIKNRLRLFFEPFNRELEDLIGSRVPDAWN